MKRELPEEGISAVSSLLGALQPFFALKGTLPARCKAFLLVALQEGLSVSEYAERAGISMSTMSRNLLDMSRCRSFNRDKARTLICVKTGYRAQHFAAITENDAHFLQVLISQVGKNREINAVFSKTLSVLGHAEHFEPVCDLLHRGHLRT